MLFFLHGPEAAQIYALAPQLHVIIFVVCFHTPKKYSDIIMLNLLNSHFSPKPLLLIYTH